MARISDAQKRLSAAQGKLRRQRLAPPLSLSDADMTVLSTVGPTDQPEVTAFVRATAGQLGVDMLEAG